MENADLCFVKAELVSVCFYCRWHSLFSSTGKTNYARPINQTACFAGLLYCFIVNTLPSHFWIRRRQGWNPASHWLRNVAHSLQFFYWLRTWDIKTDLFAIHFRIDMLAGLLMAASPWLFRFYENVYLPHVLLGFALFLSSLFTGNELSLLIQAIREKPWEKWFRMPSGQ